MLCAEYDPDGDDDEQGMEGVAAARHHHTLALTQPTPSPSPPRARRAIFLGRPQGYFYTLLLHEWEIQLGEGEGLQKLVLRAEGESLCASVCRPAQKSFCGCSLARSSCGCRTPSCRASHLDAQKGAATALETRAGLVP